MEQSESAAGNLDRTGFIVTPWVKQTLSDLEIITDRQVVEFILPEDVNHYFFIGELGRPARKYEFGGLYNPKTRVIKVQRGYAPGEIDLNAHADFIAPRLDNDGEIHDVMFHTHPWSANSPISYYTEDPINSCRPSEGDRSTLLSERAAEEDDFGIERPVKAIVSSRGYLCEMIASGLNFNEDKCVAAEMELGQIQEIKQLMGLAPLVWIGNLAKDDFTRKHLLDELERFYTEKADRSKTFSDKVRQVVAIVQDDVRDKKALDMLIEGIVGHFPKYPSKIYLRNKGFTPLQIESALSMFGYSEEIFQVMESEGIKKIV